MIVLILLIDAALMLIPISPIASMIMSVLADIRLAFLFPKTSCTGNCNQGRACTCQNKLKGK